MTSLSRLLLVALLSVVLVSGTVSGLLSYRAGLIEVGELFDAKLAHSARVLHGLVDAALDAGERAGQPLEIAVWSGRLEGHGAALETASGHAYETKLVFQVWSAEAELLLRSDNAPEQPIAPLQPGFADRVLDGTHWRSFVLRADSGRWYIAGEREEVRADISGDIARGILAPLLVALPLSALLICVVIGYGTRALRRLTAEVEVRAVDHLLPIDDTHVPQEIRGLMQAINRLLAALDDALRRERRFTADAAHELRTPLAALRLHLDNLRNASDPEARRAAERQLVRGLTRLDRLVEQLLTLSRLEPGVPLPSPQQLDLAALARDAVVELVDSGQAGDVEIELQATPAPIAGDPLGLGILLRNLLDNAARYSPRPASVRVGVRALPDAVELTVEDSGPGIAAPDRERVLDRFYRQLGTGVDGSGLGLSIVQRVAEIHRASLELDRSPALGGLRVRLRFPTAAPTPP